MLIGIMQKKNQKYGKLLPLQILLWLVLPLSSAQDAKTFFKQGMQNYMSADIDGAINNLEKAYQLDKTNTKIKSTLAKMLTFKGQDLIIEKNFGDATIFLKQAKKLGSKEAATLLKESQTKPTIYTVWLTPVLVSLGIVCMAGFFLKWMLGAREKQIIRFQKRLLCMLDERNMLSEKDKKLIVDLSSNKVQQGSIKEIVTLNPYARQRARRVEIIEEALKQENDPKLSEQVLFPFLGDRNNRVRGNAAKALFPYNKELALKTLDNMIKSTDKWMRVSAAWVFGELKTPEGMKFLTPLFRNDEDSHIRQTAMKSMESITIATSKKTKSKSKSLMS